MQTLQFSLSGMLFTLIPHLALDIHASHLNHFLKKIFLHLEKACVFEDKIGMIHCHILSMVIGKL